MFDSTSRYGTLPVLHFESAEHQEIAYVSRRLLPLPTASDVASVVAVEADERLDQIANRTLGLSTLSWRLVDLNPTLDPLALTARGSTLAIPSPFSGGSQ